MEAKDKPTNEEVRAGLTFFTLNGNGDNNPRSREVVLAMRLMGQHAYVYKSLEEVGLMKPVAGMVAIYDTDCVGSPFFERKKEDPEVPKWAQCHSTVCIGICLAAVSCYTATKEVARNLIQRFSDFDGDYHENHRQKELYRRTNPMLRAQRL